MTALARLSAQSLGAITFAAFAAVTAIAILVPFGLGDPDYNRARMTIWATLLLAVPALVLFILRAGRQQTLGSDWRAWWTAAYLTFLLHLVWGFGVMFDADVGAVLDEQGILVGGSNFLLAGLWGLSVARAWCGASGLWLHTLASLLLTVSALVSTIVFGHGPSPTIGSALLLALLGAGAWRRFGGQAGGDQPDIAAPPPPGQPVPPDITDQYLLGQFWRDIYGKEVQSAATFSYTWTADQMGHVCIGLVLDFILTVVAYELLSAGESWYEAVGFLVSALGVSVWEYCAYRSDVTKALGISFWQYCAPRSEVAKTKHGFPLDEPLLRANAIIAAGYMVIGAAVGWAFHGEACIALPAFLVLVALSILLAPRWLREKIVWQKAAIPYLSRLADFDPEATPGTVRIAQTVVNDLQAMIEADAPPAGTPRQVVIGGPIGSGRTTLACGIGTEFAFKKVCVRYLSFDTLIELAATLDFETGPIPPGPPNIGYWPWSRSQVLIIDDVAPLMVEGGLHTSANPYADMLALLRRYLGPFATALGQRHTVWILGEALDAGRFQAFADAISTFCGGTNPTKVLLPPR